tara:strand:- start:38 stop:403 length:366 start_codon:yes stop_codon:yes gene_type:complete
MNSRKDLETLAAPEGKLSKAAKKAIEIIQTFMLRNEFTTGGCTTFYSPSEWKERGEQYGHDSQLIVVYDGGDLHSVMNPHYSSFPSVYYKYEAELMRELEEEGLILEQCYSWHGAIYYEDK